MIVYLISADHAYTVRSYLRQWVSPREKEAIQIVFYEETPWGWLHLPATYIFTDIERLSAGESAAAAAYAETLLACGYRVLNRPAKVATRLELQNRLYARGINPFRQWPRASFQQSRFPAFLRRANTHAGSLGDLIHDSGQLMDRLNSLPASERLAADLILVEFCDTKDDQGRYHKFSAMRVGEAIVPRHVFTSLNWMLKIPDILDAQAVALECEFVRHFPHHDALQNVFAIGGIDFGRVDYSVQDGKIRVWEINTNPGLMPGRKKLSENRREVIEETNRIFLQALRRVHAKEAKDSSKIQAEWTKVRTAHSRFAFTHRWKRMIFGGKRP